MVKELTCQTGRRWTWSSSFPRRVSVHVSEFCHPCCSQTAAFHAPLTSGSGWSVVEKNELSLHSDLPCTTELSLHSSQPHTTDFRFYPIRYLWPVLTTAALSCWGQCELQTIKWGTTAMSSTWLPYFKRTRMFPPFQIQAWFKYQIKLHFVYFPTVLICQRR